MRSAFALRINSGKNIFMFAPLENLRIFQRCFFKRGGVAGNFPATAKSHPLRLTTFASSPKGTPLRYAENFPATAKSRPLED